MCFTTKIQIPPSHTHTPWFIEKYFCYIPQLYLSKFFEQCGIFILHLIIFNFPHLFSPVYGNLQQGRFCCQFTFFFFFPISAVKKPCFVEKIKLYMKKMLYTQFCKQYSFSFIHSNQLLDYFLMNMIVFYVLESECF